MKEKEADLPIIKVVGMSGAGKSTLVRYLREAGYNARPVSQEHSNVPNLWEHFQRPWALLYLYVDLSEQWKRRPDVTWTVSAHRQEWERLAHAREHADIRIDTSQLEPHEVAKIALLYLERIGTAHFDQPLGPLPQTGSPRTQD